MPKQPKGLSKEEKAVADDIEQAISSNSLGVRANPSVSSDTVSSKWLNPDYKLNKNEIKQAKQIINEFNKDDARQGIRNGVVWGETPEVREKGEQIQALSNKINPAASFVSGMLKYKTPVINEAVKGIPDALRAIPKAIQSIPKIGEEIVNAGSSDWINEEQKAEGTKPFINAEESLKNATAGMEQNLNNIADRMEPAINKAVEKSELNTKNVQTQNPFAYTAGDAVEQMQEQMALGNLLPEIPGLNPHVSNMITGQIADNIVQIAPDTIAKYNNGMRGKELAQEVLKDEATNALWNVGGEFVIPSLFNGIGKGINAIANKNTAQAAEDVVENAAKSAPTELPKLVEPEALAKQNAEGIDALANQQRQAAETIQDISKEIPEVPAQERSVFDILIDARRNGTTNSREAVDAINAVEKRDKEILSAAEQYANDPEVKRLVDEVGKYQEKSWENLLDVENPVNAEVIKGHEQALNNLEKYMSENVPNIPVQPVKNNYGDSIRESIKGLEMPDNVRSEVEGNLANIDGIFPRIDNAKSADEVNAILNEAKATINNADATLQKNAATRSIGKYDFDESTKNLAEAINGKRIYITPEMKAELNFTNVSKLNDSLAFKSNGKIYKPKFTTNATTGTPIDTIFPELDAATGGAISNFMRNNGMDPDNTANMAKGISDYVNFLKVNKDAVKVQKYSGGMFDDFSEAVQKAGKEKIDSFANTARNVLEVPMQNTTETGLKQLNKPEMPEQKPIKSIKDNDGSIPLDLQFFAEEAKKLTDILDSMEEGKNKNQFRQALEEFLSSVNNAKSPEEMAKAYKKVSKTYSNTLMRSGILSEEEIAKHTIPDMFVHEPEHEKESLYDAVLAMQREGKKYVKNRLKKDGFTNSDIDGMMLAYRDKVAEARGLETAGKDSDKAWEEANTIFRKIQKEGSKHGQSLQAFAKWTRNTPEGMLAEAERFVNKTVANKGKEYGIPSLLKKIQKFEFSIKFQKEFLNEAEKIQTLEPTSREFKEGMAKLGVMVNDEIRRNLSMPQLAAKRFTSYLMDNMLGNFRTLITRNAGGNFGLAAMDQFATRPLAAGIDRLVAKKTGKRTQAGLSRQALKDYLSGFKKGLAEEAQDVKKGLHTSRTGEVSLEDSIARNANIFKTDSKNKLLQGLSGIAKAYDNAVAHGLSVGDRPFYEANYKQTLGDINRFKEKGLLGKEIEKLSKEEYKTLSEGIAKLKALEAVYQNDSVLSDALMGFKKDIGQFSEGTLGFDILSQFTMPFVKTPANVVDRAIDYSPVGAVRNIVKTAKEGGIGGENFNQNRFVNETARNIIGTGLMTGAGAAAYNGYISNKYSDDKDEKQAQKNAGMQEYALNIPDNDGTSTQVDISWIPIVGSNAVAASAAVNAANDPELNAVDKTLAGLKGGGKAMMDQAFFQGLQRLFGQGESYNSDEGIVGNMINTIKQGATQTVPSLVRQGTQVADTYQRDLGNGDYDTNSYKNTLPGLRETLQPKVDNEGNYIKQNQGRSVGMKVLENMILPGKISHVEYTDLDKEAQRLQKITKNNIAYQPKASRKDITTDTHIPTNEEYTQYQVDRNKAITEVGKELLKSDFYKNATPEDQENMLKNLYEGIKDYEKSKYVGSEMKTKIGKAYSENKTKGAIDEMAYKAELNKYDANDGQKVREAYEKGGKAGLDRFLIKKRDEEYRKTAAQKKMFSDAGISGSAEDIQKELASYGAIDSSSTVKYYAHAKETIPSLTTKQYADTLRKIGGSDYKINQKEMLDYFNNNNLSESEVNKYWNAYGDWKTIPKLKKGVWKASKK